MIWEVKLTTDVSGTRCNVETSPAWRGSVQVICRYALKTQKSLCRAWQLISPVESGSVFQVYGGHYHFKHLFCSQDDVPANKDFSG